MEWETTGMALLTITLVKGFWVFMVQEEETSSVIADYQQSSARTLTVEREKKRKRGNMR